MKKHFIKIIGFISILLSLLLCGAFIYAIYPELNMGKEPDFPKIRALPNGNELLFFQTGSGLHVSTLSGKVNKWEPSEKFYDANYSWSQKHALFSIWGKEWGSNSENRNFYTISLSGQIEMIEGVEPYAIGYEHEWSPNGHTIAFPNLSENPYDLSLTDIFLNEYRKSDPKQLTFLPNGSVYDLAWSPNGNYIAFVYSQHEPKQSDILYEADIRDGSITQFKTGLEGHYSFPKWSPDGNWLSFLHRENIDEPYSLWILNISTSEVHLLFKPPKNKYVANLTWSPNSQQIAFASNHEGSCKRFVAQQFEIHEEYTLCGYQIYVVDIDGKNMKRITKIVSYWNPLRLFWLKVGG